MNKKQNKITGGYRLWKLRQKLVRFAWKASIVLLALSGLSWLMSEGAVCVFFWHAAKYMLLAMVLLVISQSVEVHDIFVETDFEKKDE